MGCILSLNCGTSSAKYAMFDRSTLSPLCRGVVERVSIGGSFIRHITDGQGELKVARDCPDHSAAIQLILEALSGRLDGRAAVVSDLAEIEAVGHRVLHGGYKFVKSALVTPEVHQAIEDMIEFGPLHNPANLAGIDAIAAVLPEVPQVAVFDTAFFQTMPEKAFLYGSPYAWYEKYRIRKYGFHGTSHLYISRRAAVLLGKKPADTNLVTLHIGNGISLTAVRGGVAVEHSMGVSPLEGVMMGTRSGSVDPSVVTYIANKENLSAEDVVAVQLNRKSGLFGMTGLTDVRDLTQRMLEGDERCRLALDIYCYKIKSFLGSYLAVLDYDVDALVFAGGVGENSSWVRSQVLSGFEGIGIRLDPAGNERRSREERDIAAADSRVRILIVPTNEEQVLLEDVVAILNGTYDVHTQFSYSFEDPAWKQRA